MKKLICNRQEIEEFKKEYKEARRFVAQRMKAYAQLRKKVLTDSIRKSKKTGDFEIRRRCGGVQTPKGE